MSLTLSNKEEQSEVGTASLGDEAEHGVSLVVEKKVSVETTRASVYIPWQPEGLFRQVVALTK